MKPEKNEKKYYSKEISKNCQKTDEEAVPGPLQPGSEARQRGLQEVRRGSSAASPGTARVHVRDRGPRAQVPGIIFDSIFQFKIFFNN